jgi:hypothetical protein
MHVVHLTFPAVVNIQQDISSHTTGQKIKSFKILNLFIS